jgi:hypothetical protein
MILTSQGSKKTMYDSKYRKQLLKHRTVCVVGEDSNNMFR